MICLFVVLFFAITGITLNHPNWMFGDHGSRVTTSGTLAAGYRDGTTVDWLQVSEFFRNTHNVKGRVSSHNVSGTEGSITFKGPGYGADAFFDTETGTYDLTIEAQGFVALMNDLHKGRDVNSSWRWVIDLAGGFLVVISASGLALQLFLRKRRKRALITAGGGVLLIVLLMVMTTR
jgi:hypothetical protein